MSEVPYYPKPPEKPKDAPDHPYYHPEKFSPWQWKEFNLRQEMATRFLYNTFTPWVQRQNVLSGKNVDEDLIEEHKDKGEFTPNEVIDLFKKYKDSEILSLTQGLVEAYDKENRAKMDFWIDSIAAQEHLTLYDVWLAGTWEADNEAHTGRKPEIPAVDPGLAAFDQYVALFNRRNNG